VRMRKNHFNFWVMGDLATRAKINCLTVVVLCADLCGNKDTKTAFHIFFPSFLVRKNRNNFGVMGEFETKTTTLANSTLSCDPRWFFVRSAQLPLLRSSLWSCRTCLCFLQSVFVCVWVQWNVEFMESADPVCVLSDFVVSWWAFWWQDNTHTCGRNSRFFKYVHNYK